MKYNFLIILFLISCQNSDPKSRSSKENHKQSQKTTTTKDSLEGVWEITKSEIGFVFIRSYCTNLEIGSQVHFEDDQMKVYPKNSKTPCYKYITYISENEISFQEFDWFQSFEIESLSNTTLKLKYSYVPYQASEIDSLTYSKFYRELNSAIKQGYYTLTLEKK